MAPKYEILAIGGQDAGAAIPTATPSPIPTSSRYEVLSVGQEPPPDERGFLQRAVDAAYLPAGQIAQGMSFGFGDEIEAGLRGAAGALGLGDESYSQALDRIRAENQQFQTENPYEAAAYQAGGGVLGSLAGGAALKGVQLASKGKDAYNAAQAIKAAKAAEAARKATTTGLVGWGALKGGGAGLAGGSLAGFGTGEGGFYNRLGEMATQGIIGGGLGTGIGALAGGLQALARTETAQRAMQSMSRPPQILRSGERGSVTLGGLEAPRDTLPQLSEAESVLMGSSRMIPREQLDDGVSRLAAALDSGSPMLPAEGINQGALYQITDDVRWHPWGVGKADEFLESRGANQNKRYYAAFDDAVGDGGGSSSIDNLTDLQNAMKSKVAALEDTRDKAANVLYQKAPGTTPVMSAEQVENLLEEEPILKKAVKEVRQFGETLDGQKTKDLPDNSLAILSAVKKKIGNEIEILAKLGKKEDAAQYSRLQSKLVAAIEKASPEYREADKFFAGESGAIARFKGGEKERGIYESILNVKEENASQIGSKLFSLHPQQITEIKDSLGAEYEKQFLRGVKGHLQTLVERGKDGREELVDFVKSDIGKQKLKAALGEDNYTKLDTFLDKEKLIHKGDLAWGKGSPTFPRQQVAEKRKEQIGKLRKLISTITNPSPGAIADEMIASSPPMEDYLMKQMAEILFDPEKGRAAFEKISKYRNMREPYLEGLQTYFDNARYGGVMGASAVDKDLPK